MTRDSLKGELADAQVKVCFGRKHHFFCEVRKLANTNEDPEILLKLSNANNNQKDTEWHDSTLMLK